MKIGNKEFKVTVPDDPRKGLLGTKSIAKDRLMKFSFPNGNAHITMVGMKYPIDLIATDKGKVIDVINAKVGEEYKFKGTDVYEGKLGSGVKVGDVIKAQKGVDLTESKERGFMSYLNPKNWGVKDLSGSGSFKEAYGQAKKAKEGEFMYGDNRYKVDDLPLQVPTKERYPLSYNERKWLTDWYMHPETQKRNKALTGKIINIGDLKRMQDAKMLVAPSSRIPDFPDDISGELLRDSFISSIKGTELDKYLNVLPMSNSEYFDPNTDAVRSSSIWRYRNDGQLDLGIKFTDKDGTLLTQDSNPKLLMESEAIVHAYNTYLNQISEHLMGQEDFKQKQKERSEIKHYLQDKVNPYTVAGLNMFTPATGKSKILIAEDQPPTTKIHELTHSSIGHDSPLNPYIKNYLDSRPKLETYSPAREIPAAINEFRYYLNVKPGERIDDTHLIKLRHEPEFERYHDMLNNPESWETIKHLMNTISENKQSQFVTLAQKGSQLAKLHFKAKYGKESIDTVKSHSKGGLLVLDDKANVQHEISDGSRIFSRVHTKQLLSLRDKIATMKAGGPIKESHKELAELFFKLIAYQDKLEPEYV